MATVLITGGTGLVGTALSNHLIARGYDVILLTRNPDQSSAITGLQYALWNVENNTIELQAFQAADHIVHLAGAGVMDRKWTTRYKNEIVKSRVDSSRLLVSTLQNYPNKVQSVISASAIGWYGRDSKPLIRVEGFIETDPPDKTFLGETCRLWEESIQPVTLLNKRLVKLRLGIVLSEEGGALAEFKKPLKFGIAGILGSGKQIVSWIHMEDLCRLFQYAIENDHIQECYNAVAPKPVSNQKLTLELAARVRGRFYVPLPVPKFMLKLILGEKSIEVLKSATVSDQKIKKAGFQFLFPSIDAALDDLVAKRKA